MSDLACGAMLLISTDRRERVYVCLRDPHDRGQHDDMHGTRWEARGEDQPVTRAASR